MKCIEGEKVLNNVETLSDSTDKYDRNQGKGIEVSDVFIIDDYGVCY